MTSTLGKNTNKVSPAKQAESRNKRILLREHAGELLPSARVAWCSQRRRHGESQVFYAFSESQHKASFHNVMMCGSVWTCPVCSARISEIRRAELEQALSFDAELLPVMITFTLQHNAGERLADLLTALNDSVRKLKSGKAWLTTKSRFHLEHYVTALEVMHGGSGWHPHKHMLAFLRMAPEAFNPDELKAALLERYKRILGKHGKYILDNVGIDVRAVNGRKELNNYMSKLSMSYEISKSASKIGRQEEHYSPFQLLSLSMAGAEKAGELFKEYALAMAGKKFIQWSHGAREFFQLDAELTDEEIVERLELQEQDDTIRLLAFGKSTWKKIVSKRLIPGLLMLGGSGDAETVRDAALAFLELHDIQRIECEVMT